MSKVEKILCVFDLDGTIIDSKEAILSSALRTLNEFNVSKVDERDILGSIGLPISRAFERYLSGDALESAVKSFRSDLAENGSSKTYLYADTISTLQELADMGVTLALATNKHAPLAREVLKQQGIGNYFSEVQGADSSPAKPSPEMLLKLKLKFPDMSLYVMVGDRGEDMVAAKSAGYFGYFIDHGTIPSDSLKPDPNVRHISTLGEIAFCLHEDWKKHGGE
jgi:phosphoglycolate phosphatase